MKISWTVAGDLDMAAKLAQLRRPSGVLRGAVSRGLTVLQRAIRALIPARVSRTVKGGPGPGNVNRSIKQSIGQKIDVKGSDRVVAKVGVSLGTSRASKLGLTRRQAVARLTYIHGTKARRTRAGRYTGFVNPKDYVTRGGRSAAGEANALITSELNRRLDAALTKQHSRSTTLISN